MTTLRWRFTATVPGGVKPVIAALRKSVRAGQSGSTHVHPMDDGIAVQGDWWYRGEYHVRPVNQHESQVSYEVHNVADPSTRWLVPFVTRGDRERHQEEFNRLIANLTRDL